MARCHRHNTHTRHTGPFCLKTITHSTTKLHAYSSSAFSIPTLPDDMVKNAAQNKKTMKVHKVNLKKTKNTTTPSTLDLALKGIPHHFHDSIIPYGRQFAADGTECGGRHCTKVTEVVLTEGPLCPKHCEWNNGAGRRETYADAHMSDTLTKVPTPFCVLLTTGQRGPRILPELDWDTVHKSLTDGSTTQTTTKLTKDATVAVRSGTPAGSTTWHHLVTNLLQDTTSTATASTDANRGTG